MLSVLVQVDEWAQLVKTAGMEEYTEGFGDFQDWLTGLPGVDEATALASVRAPRVEMLYINVFSMLLQCRKCFSLPD